MIDTHVRFFESLSLLGLLLLLLCPVGATLLRCSASATLVVGMVLMVAQVLLGLVMMAVLEAVRVLRLLVLVRGQPGRASSRDVIVVLSLPRHHIE